MLFYIDPFHLTPQQMHKECSHIPTALPFFFWAGVGRGGGGGGGGGVKGRERKGCGGVGRWMEGGA